MKPDTPPSNGQLPPPSASSRHFWLLAILGMVVLGIGVWLVSTRLTHWLTTTESGPAAPGETGAAGPVRKIQATMFYLSPDGTELVPVSREVLYGASPAEQVRQLVEAQVEAPPAGRLSAIPNGTTVRAVFLTPRGEAYVDLGGAILTGNSGGSLNEALAVYAIVNAVTVNLPDLSAVQILVNGKQVDTLVGHLDLRYPLGKSLQWVRKGP